MRTTGGNDASRSGKPRKKSVKTPSKPVLRKSPAIPSDGLLPQHLTTTPVEHGADDGIGHGISHDAGRTPDTGLCCCFPVFYGAVCWLLLRYCLSACQLNYEITLIKHITVLDRSERLHTSVIWTCPLHLSKAAKSLLFRPNFYTNNFMMRTFLIYLSYSDENLWELI